MFSTALPAAPSALLLTLSVLLVFLNSLCWYGFLAWSLSRESIRRAYRRSERLVGKIAGACLAALGLRVLGSALETVRG